MIIIEPRRDNANNVDDSEASDEHGRPPSLVRVFAVRSIESCVAKLCWCIQRLLGFGWGSTSSPVVLSTSLVSVFHGADQFSNLINDLV